MRRCPSCGAMVVASRVVCEKCGHDVAPSKDNDGVYGRGAGSLMRTRAGIRLAAVLGGFAIAGVCMALGVPGKIVIGATLGVFLLVAAWAIVQIFRASPD